MQLASAIATLPGRRGDGLIDRLLVSTGLDDLGLTTDDYGKVALRAGKYLSENLYTDVEVRGNGTTKLNLNLNISGSLTIRGSAPGVRAALASSSNATTDLKTIT